MVTSQENQALAAAVRRFQAGEREAFGDLYEQTYQSKYFLALKLMKQREAAEDAVQEAYMKAMDKLDTLQDPAAFSGWLGQIVANTCKNLMKKQSPQLFTDLAREDEEGDVLEPLAVDEDPENQPELSYTRQETQELVRVLLDELKDEQRYAMSLYYLEGLTAAQIAQAADCPLSTIKSRLAGGRKHIRAKAEELQKKGMTLYGLSPMALLAWLLRRERESMAAEGLLELSQGARAAILAAAQGTTAAAQGSAAAAASQTAAAAQTASAAQGAAAAAGTAVKAGFFHTVAGKATALVLACTVAGGGSAVVTNVLLDRQEAREAAAVVESRLPEQSEPPAEPDGLLPRLAENELSPQDSRWPELLGGFTCEQLLTITGMLPDSSGFTPANTLRMVDDLAARARGDESYGIRSFGQEKDTWRSRTSLEDINRYLALLDVELTADNCSDVHGQELWVSTIDSLRGYCLLDSATLVNGELHVQFRSEYFSSDGESGGVDTGRSIILRPRADGRYVVRELMPLEEYRQRYGQEPTPYGQRGEGPWSQYQTVLDHAMDQGTPWVSPRCDYILHDLDADDRPELILLLSETSMDEWDGNPTDLLRVYTAGAREAALLGETTVPDSSLYVGDDVRLCHWDFNQGLLSVRALTLADGQLRITEAGTVPLDYTQMDQVMSDQFGLTRATLYSCLDRTPFTGDRAH